MGGYAVISGAKPGSSYLSFCSQCEITGDTKRAAFRWRDGSFTFTLIGLQTMRKHSLTQWETIEISEIRPKKQESKGSNYITQYEALCLNVWAPCLLITLWIWLICSNTFASTLSFALIICCSVFSLHENSHVLQYGAQKHSSVSGGQTQQLSDDALLRVDGSRKSHTTQRKEKWWKQMDDLWRDYRWTSAEVCQIRRKVQKQRWSCRRADGCVCKAAGSHSQRGLCGFKMTIKHKTWTQV